MIYFTADLHFYHDNIIKHANRPFRDSEEMNRALIRNWNRAVNPKDEVYILGDFTMKGPAYAAEILSQLKGRKYLVQGNHDSFVHNKEFDSSVFEWIKDYCELTCGNEKFILFHYPIEEWNGYFRGAIQLHGHQHNHADYNFANLEKGIRRYDVGVDANNMKPVSIEEIIAFFSL
ncbi:MAG: metallophosphoesterase family protein [Clostridium sp.]|nr:metallophosphoesterase family protein [Clostridium sp.]